MDIEVTAENAHGSVTFQRYTVNFRSIFTAVKRLLQMPEISFPISPNWSLTAAEFPYFHIRVRWARANFSDPTNTFGRVFADAKEKHGMRYTPYGGLAQVTKWGRLKLVALNLKKLEIYLRKDCRCPLLYATFIRFGVLDFLCA